MKKTTSLVLALLVGLSASFAQAKDNTGNKAGSYKETVTYTHSAPEKKSGIHWGLGLSTLTILPTTPTSITGWIELGDDTGIQPFFSIGGTSPFTISATGILKHTVVGEGHGMGFHIGVGFGVGNPASTFGMMIPAVMGLHAAFPGASQIMLHLDGGPVFTYVSSTAGFSVAALSPALGLSAVYMF